MTEVTRLLRIYEELIDDSTEIAEEHGLDFASYGGQAACLLNQLNGYNLKPRETKLIVDTHQLQIPPLSSFVNAYEDRQQDYIDIRFPSQQDLDTFVERAADSGISGHERMNRALRLSNFILVNLADWHEPAIVHQGTLIEGLRLG